MHNCIAIGISLPKEIMKKIDTDRGDIPRSRYLLRILQKALEYKGRKEYKIGKNNDQDGLDHNAVESEMVKQSPST